MSCHKCTSLNSSYKIPSLLYNNYSNKTVTFCINHFYKLSFKSSFFLDYQKQNELFFLYRLLSSVSLCADVGQSIMTNISGVHRLPRHPHTKCGFFIDLYTLHSMAGSLKIRDGEKKILDRWNHWADNSQITQRSRNPSQNIKKIKDDKTLWHLIYSTFISVSC